jgi:hypothetical protein
MMGGTIMEIMALAALIWMIRLQSTGITIAPIPAFTLLPAVWIVIPMTAITEAGILLAAALTQAPSKEIIMLTVLELALIPRQTVPVLIVTARIFARQRATEVY